MELPSDITLRFAARERDAALPVEGLSVGEREQVASFGSEKRRREYALGRIVARDLLAERLEVARSAVPLRVADDGAPEAVGTALHVSISHVATETQTFAVAAAAPCRLGVDLELIRPRHPDLYRFLLAPEDYGVLDTLPQGHDEAQVLIWTLKEAVLKGLRTGFRLSPKKVRLVFGVGERCAEAHVGETTWALRYERREGCFLALAYLL